MKRKVKHYKVELYKKRVWYSLNKEWAWRVRASNGEIIGKSTETYVNRSDAVYNIQSLGLSLFSFRDK